MAKRKKTTSSPSGESVCDNVDTVTACYCTHQRGYEPIDNSDACLYQQGSWVEIEVPADLCDCLYMNVCPTVPGCYWDSDTSSCVMRTGDACESTESE